MRAAPARRDSRWRPRARALDDVPDGVFVVRLATVTDPALVLPAIAEALGVSEGAGQSLAVFLARRELLLVIDNVEQVADAAPQLAELLVDVPGRPDAADEPRADAPLARARPRRRADGAGGCGGALRRAGLRRSLPTFAVTDDNRDAVVEICVRLDGLPLAIELAAARINLLSPARHARPPERPPEAAHRRGADQPARQRTLRDTLAWSHAC